MLWKATLISQVKMLKRDWGQGIGHVCTTSLQDKHACNTEAKGQLTWPRSSSTSAQEGIQITTPDTQSYTWFRIEIDPYSADSNTYNLYGLPCTLPFYSTLPWLPVCRPLFSTFYSTVYWQQPKWEIRGWFWTHPLWVAKQTARWYTRKTFPGWMFRYKF